MQITQEEFAIFTRTIREITGISLDATKAYLIEARLSPLLNDYSCANFSELYYKIKTDQTGELKRKVIDKITTQETSFFRDQAPFEMLKFKIIPDLIDARRKQFPDMGKIPVRIWSAASSTGQELYSIAIALHHALGDVSKFAIKILGTDISDSAISKASYGVYSKFEIERGMQPDHVDRFFVKNGDSYKVKDEIRSMVSFRRFNLFDDFGTLGRWDIVFCRNVAIYFSDEDKKNIFDRIARTMETDAYLIIGSTESLLGVCPVFEAQRYLRSTFYCKK